MRVDAEAFRWERGVACLVEAVAGHAGEQVMLKLHVKPSMDPLGVLVVGDV